MPRRDPVTPDLRERILRRDRVCFMSRLNPSHVCYDAFGRVHPADDRRRLTLEHVHDGYGRMGRRAPSDERHIVALCYRANVGVPSKATRQAMRAYLAGVPIFHDMTLNPHDAHVDPCGPTCRDRVTA